MYMGNPKEKGDFADITLAATLVSAGVGMDNVRQLG